MKNLFFIFTYLLGSFVNAQLTPVKKYVQHDITHHYYPPNQGSLLINHKSRTILYDSILVYDLKAVQYCYVTKFNRINGSLLIEKRAEDKGRTEKLRWSLDYNGTLVFFDDYIDTALHERAVVTLNPDSSVAQVVWTIKGTTYKTNYLYDDYTCTGYYSSGDLREKLEVIEKGDRRTIHYWGPKDKDYSVEYIYEHNRPVYISYNNDPKETYTYNEQDSLISRVDEYNYSVFRIDNTYSTNKKITVKSSNNKNSPVISIHTLYSNSGLPILQTFYEGKKKKIIENHCIVYDNQDREIEHETTVGSLHEKTLTTYDPDSIHVIKTTHKNHLVTKKEFITLSPNTTIEKK
jgi:hypothetical protein